MCGIFFFIGDFLNDPDFLNTIKPHFLKTTGRGPDDNQLIQIGNKIFGFHRLSIVDLSRYIKKEKQFQNSIKFRL